MNREDARKLLGGYATGNLTVEERRLLFEAALDDQELFDALAEEQSLKDVLDDPVSRERVRLAAAAAPRPRAWWNRPWIWVPAASALAASVLTVSLVKWKPGEPQVATKRAEIADNRPVPKAAPAANPADSRDAKQPRGYAKSRPANPAPHRTGEAAPAPQREQAPAATEPPAQSASNTANTANSANSANSTGGGPGNTRSDGENSQRQQDSRQQARRDSQQSVAEQAKVEAQASVPRPAAPASMARMAGALATPRAGAAPVAWSLLTRDAEGRESDLAAGTRPRVGDRIRLRVQSSAPGYLEVQRRASSGAWEPFYPAAGKRIVIAARTVYIVPDVPLEVRLGETLRLVWSPEAAMADEVRPSAGFRKTKERFEAKKDAAIAQPIIIDIPLSPVP